MQLCTRYIKRYQRLKAILAVINTSDLYCKQKSRGMAGAYEGGGGGGGGSGGGGGGSDEPPFWL